MSDWSSDVCSSYLGIFVAYILLCGLWLATGWHQGPNAVLMGTVAVAFFGGGDEPGKAIAAFGRFAVLSLFLAAILAYGLLPLANDFPTFLIVMGLFMLPSACGRRDGKSVGEGKSVSVREEFGVR